MPKKQEPSSGFQPIQYTPGPQNRPAVPEVDFQTPAPQEPATRTQRPRKPRTAAQTKKATAPSPKPRTAAQTKED